ncbi:MAG: DUF1080 domain-containing protein [Flavobacteriaceae bacterium]
MNIKLYHYSLLISMVFLFGCNKQGNDIRHLFKEGSNDWLEMGDATWSFDQGELKAVVKNGSGFVMTRERYKDFILELDFFPDSSINSGVFIRCQEKALSASDCYEINIWDEHPDQTARTGAVVRRSPPLDLVRTADRWNRYRIVCRENRITAWINNIKVVDLRDSSLVKGFIGLQAAESGSIRFRNIKLSLIKK